MNVFRVAIWGLGNHAKNRILPSISSMKELSLFGVCSRNKKTVSECALKWSCKGWIDPKEMLEDKTLDIIIISTPIGVHAKHVNKALRAGKHVWCEKPLTCDYNDTQELIDLAKTHNKMLAECFMFFHHPQFLRIIKFINTNELGKVRFVNCRFGIPFLDFPGFRYDSKLCGGAFWDIASYPISAILELFPNKKIEVKFAEFSKKKPFSVDTDGRALLNLSDNIKAYIDWGIGLGYRNEIDIWTDKGSLYTDKFFSKPEKFRTIFRHRDINGNESIEYGEISEQFVNMFRNFHSALNNTKFYLEEMERIQKRAKLMNEILNFNP